jgi:hypothetical protein
VVFILYLLCIYSVFILYLITQLLFCIYYVCILYFIQMHVFCIVCAYFKHIYPVCRLHVFCMLPTYQLCMYYVFYLFCNVQTHLFCIYSVLLINIHEPPSYIREGHRQFDVIQQLFEHKLHVAPSSNEYRRT